MLTLAIAILALSAGGYLLYIELWRHWHLTKVEVRTAQSDANMIAPDVRGLLPVLRSSIVNTEQAALVLASKYIDTQMPVANVPNSINYAPHMHYSAKSEAGQLPELAENIQQASGQVLNFQQLFEGGKLPQKGFLVGYELNSGEPIVATWKNLYSALIGGQSGSGKSTLIRSLLAQAAMQRSRFVVVDPHYGAGEESLGKSLEPLRSLMLCDIASSNNEMVDALAYVEGIGRKRISGEDTDKTPVVLVVDETTGLLQRGAVADNLVKTLGFISQETRKVGIFAFCIGQNFTGKVMPTEVRNSFVSFISCRARRDVARVQSGSLEFGHIAESLTPGQAVWMMPSGETHTLTVPNCTSEHLHVISREITCKSENSPALTVNRHFPATPNTTALATTTATLSSAEDDDSKPVEEAVPVVAPVVADARSQRVVDMFLNGETPKEIIVKVWGVKPKGNDFIKASKEFQEILRSHLLIMQGKHQ